MKGFKLAALLLVVIVGMVIAAVCVSAMDTADRIRAKFKQVQTAINVNAHDHKPMDGVMASVIEFKKYLDAGDAVRAEATLDALLKRKEIANVRQPSVPTNEKAVNIAKQAADEPNSDAFENSQLVEVVGYSDHAMEPCITPDGKFLFFNNSNEPSANTRIHLTKRINQNIFQYVGVLPGTVSGSKDMAPSIDRSGIIYFTSLRSYDKDQNSLYVGKFDGSCVRDVSPVSGDVTPKVPCWINMDCCVSEDGGSLVVSRARFDLGTTVPSESDLMLFERTNGMFVQTPRDAVLMRNINTPALEYAPSLSADRLTLYFTRAQKLPGRGDAPTLRILMAQRPSLTAPFSAPQVIKCIYGFVEAPTLPSSGRELFYHKMDNGRFKIFRCERKRSN